MAARQLRDRQGAVASLMCVGDGSADRTSWFSRGTFLATASAVTLPFAHGPGAIAHAADTDAYPLPPTPAGLSAGNARAAGLAANSGIVRSTYARVTALAHSIGDSSLRASVLELLRDPQPLYARAHPTAAARIAVRDMLAAASLVAADAPVAGIFPAGTETAAAFAIQPFWSTPGSSDGSHHAYPGGLAVHEYFNAAMAETFAQTYDRHYFADAATVDRDTVIGAALYHDSMKTVVFGWNPDGTLFDELTIAGTGAHHILSGAEAIARGRSPAFVTTLLSAHAAPSLGDETKVAAWCRAAAIVAGVDPVATGLLTAAGTLAADPVPLEAFINHLSDHDYVLSVHAMHVVSDRLRSRYDKRRALPEAHRTFAWYRSAILTRTTAIALYDTLARRGSAAFDSAVLRAENAVPAQ